MSSVPSSRIYAIDFARLIVITNVVTVHVLAQLPETTFLGGIGMLIHVNREIFLLISSLVLSYSYGLRPKVVWANFFRRRYTLVLVPYLTWTVIYAALGNQLGTNIGKDLLTVGHYLINGRAWYHLYFLLILLQLYLIFPLLRWFMNATKRHHTALFVAAAIWQLAFTYEVQRSWGAYGPLGPWLGNPDAWLISYVFYIVAGAVAAWHLPQLLAWVDRYSRRLGWLAVLTAGASVLVYLWQLHSGMSIDVADTTFQPMIVVESTMFGLAALAAGRAWERRGTPGRRWVMYGSVATFGIYLVHPLMIQLVVWLGGLAALAHVPQLITILILLFVGVPVVVALSLVFSEIFIRTPLSLPLVGRPREKRR
jgi:peptidoglycan/LPS O-acetylase OafA/YrhL